MRLLALTGVVLVALVGAGSAQALTEPASTKLRAITPSELKAFIQSPDFVANPANNTNPTVQTGVARMQTAAGRLASVKTLGTISVIATGAVVVWKIADAAGVGGYVYKKITGTDTATYSTATNMRWHCHGSPSPCNPTTAITHTNGNEWRLRIDTHTGINWTVSAAIDTQYVGPPSPGACSNPNPAEAELCAAGVALGTSATWINHNGTNDYYILRSQNQMEDALTYEPSDAAEFASPPVGATTATAGTNDDTLPSDVELEAALDRIDPSPGTAGTAIEQDTAEAILDELEPGWAEGILLQPLPNETYTQYITRLQAEGWVGDATTTVLATEQPGYGPEAVVRVIATPVGGTTTVYDPLNWPSPGPTIDADADITIRYNPDTAPEAPTTTTPTPITGAPTTIPGTPAVDFSPITELDPGCKFPYGFVCYAVDFTEQFSVTADAPVFSFDLGVDIPLCNDCEAAYVVDLEVMDGYMALWRGILTVVLWVGAIYLVATRLLGFNAGGDPGEAIDDVL